MRYTRELKEPVDAVTLINQLRLIQRESAKAISELEERIKQLETAGGE